MLSCFRAPLAVSSALVLAGASMISASPAQDDKTVPASVNPRWLDKLDKVDRAFVDENIGYAAPEFTEDLKWHDGTALTWETLRERVVVIQSWTTKTSGGRSAPTRIAKALESFPADQVQLIALHTPEGLETIEKFLEQRDLPMPVVIDEKGRFCDELGFYQRPSNVVVDKHGAIRYAGLNAAGIEEAVKVLLAESYDKSRKPEARPKPEAEVSDAEFPSFNTQQLSANNIQGQRAPELTVQMWMNGTPEARGKVVIVDFWATWCGPCVASIPHMNDIANRFRDDLVAVGLTNEGNGTVANFMQRTPMQYSVAIDTQGTMSNALGVRGIPHVMVISSDWIVRWQGHPASLSEAIVRQIVEANKKIAGGANARYRWSGGSA